MPDYVCPECGEPIVSRAVLVEGTLLHYACHTKLKARVARLIPPRLRSVSNGQ